MIESCRNCRFWMAQDGEPPEDEGFGWCRRHPPVVSDHMAKFSIGGPGWGGRDRYDPEDSASIVNVHNACLIPATYSTAWCGEWSDTNSWEAPC